MCGRQPVGDNVHGRKGNNPDRQLRSLNPAEWERMWERIDNQEVGLEAAILERKRNSSLVKRTCAEDVTGLSWIPKLRTPQGVVGERSMCSEGRPTRTAGAHGSEDAGMSSDKEGENPSRRKPKVSWARLVLPGLVGT